MKNKGLGNVSTNDQTVTFQVPDGIVVEAIYFE